MRVRFLITVILLVCAGPVFGQNTLRALPIEGLPDGSRITAYAIVEAEEGERLVAEVEGPDGLPAFYLFVYSEGSLIATVIGPRTIPAEFEEPPTHRPVTRRIEGQARRYWHIDTAGRAGAGTQLVSAPNLEELRFADIGAGSYQLSPPVGSPFTLSLVHLGASGELSRTCVLEPNILALSDRMTTTGGWWIEPFDNPHLLVGMAGELSDGTGEIRPRLYNERGELVAVSASTVAYQVNRIPALVRADLTDDGVQEYLLFPTADSQTPVLVLQAARGESADRVLSFNLCSERMNGADVVRLQEYLAANGYDLGPNRIDGWYGPDTRAAVIRWQRDTGRRVSGVVDLSQTALREQD